MEDKDLKLRYPPDSLPLSVITTAKVSGIPISVHSDLSSGSPPALLLSTGYNMDNNMDGFYIVPAFMDKLVVHLTKNYMTLPNIKLVPAVTELVVAELMYLQWMDPKDPIYLYINSTGTTRDDGETTKESCGRSSEITQNTQQHN